MLPLRDNAPKGTEPVVTMCLLFICIVVFFLQLIYPGGFEKSMEVWGEVPTRILSGGKIPGTEYSAYWTWLSSMFMHGGVLHLIGNMVALWLFGDNVEWVMGRFRYLIFYLACGILANVATTFLGFQGNNPGIGASGAIAGVMAAYLIYYPSARITSLIWIDPFSIMHLATGSVGFTLRNISAIWYVGSWILLQLFLSGLFLSSATFENLGIYAHAAGALVGVALCFPLALRSRRPGPDHPAVSGELTPILWGEEGDAGGGRDALSVEEELERLRLEHPTQGGPFLAPPIQDYIADELVAKGDIEGAVRHCEDMRSLAWSRGESDKVEGYTSLLDSLRKSREAKSPSTDPGW